jgi:hypothetical protein
MSSVRQQVLYRTLFILLFVIPAIFYKSDNKYINGIEICILFYGLYQFYRLAGQFQRFIDDIYPPKLSKTAKKEKVHQIAFYGSQIIFYTSVFFHLALTWWTRDTILVTNLFWQSFLVGFIISVVVTIILVWKAPSIYFESTRRLTVHFGIFLGLSTFFPALAIFTNHYFADKKINCENYIINRKEKVGRYNSPWIYLTIENKEDRIHISKKIFDNLEEKGKVNICTRIGLWGFEFVEEIKSIIEN